MEITIRRFQETDIPYKVKWINDDRNNKYLHYNLPLVEDKTLLWFDSVKDQLNRVDYTILIEGQPVGLIGLLNIDQKNRKAEYYIALGEDDFKGKGIAKKSSDLLIRETYQQYNLNKIYLYTEVENIPAQRLFDKIGFVKEGILKEDLIQDDKKIDRFLYGLFVEEYLNKENH